MEVAYRILINEDMLKEITKWHILQYIHFPSVFLEKLCDDMFIDKLKWLLNDKLVTVDLLNAFVRDIFTEYYKKPSMDNYIIFIEIKSFIEYLLYFKFCPKMFWLIFNNFPLERDDLLASKNLELEEVQIHLKQHFSDFDLLYKNAGIVPVCYEHKVQKDELFSVKTRDIGNEVLDEDFGALLRQIKQAKDIQNSY